MASESKSPQALIQTEGFVLSEDAALGERASAMSEDGVPIHSVEGFLFLKHNVIDNLVITELIQSYLQSEIVYLLLYRTLGPVPGTYSFRQSSADAPAESVLVHIIKKASKVVIWKNPGKATVPVSAPKGGIPLFEADPVNLTGAGLERTEENLEYGGYCIRDTRVFMEVVDGSAITFAIVTPDVLRKLGPMKLDESLRATVEEIQTPFFRIHARYE